MEIKEAIFGRHTVRKFSDRYISNETIRKIVEAGIYAPSACNLQNWKFIVVRNGNRNSYYNEIVANAPILIFVAYRCDIKNVTGYKHKDYVQSAAAAIQNILLMSYSEGLGSCWICDLPENDVLQKHFEVPENYEILAAIAIGYIADEENNNSLSQKLFHTDNIEMFDSRKRKYSVDEVLYLEKFGNYLYEINDKEEAVNQMISDNCVKDYWVKCMLKIANPVLENCANDQLKEKMPIGTSDIKRGLRYAHLEALGRTILGISAWLEKKEKDPNEEEFKNYYRKLARKCIENSVNPNSKDYMNWDDGDQPLVDAAFFALGILQAKEELWNKLSLETQKNVLYELKKTRKIAPWRSNWILFSAMIEVFVYEMEGEEDCVKSVIDYAVTQFEQWYVGDGFYKDGDCFHFDYYESIVIHPFLLTIAEYIPWVEKDKYVERSLRYSKILVNMVNKDGTYPLIGRSICYRGGVFHVLSKIVCDGICNVSDKNNVSVTCDEIRTILMSILNNFMSHDIFDKAGWLKVGLVDEQKGLAEEYVNTGSLYMFLSMFLILGCDDEFWNGNKIQNSSIEAWNGKDIEADKSLEGWVKLKQWN